MSSVKFSVSNTSINKWALKRPMLSQLLSSTRIRAHDIVTIHSNVSPNLTFYQRKKEKRKKANGMEWNGMEDMSTGKLIKHVKPSEK
jgi:hypothetical protein